MGMIGYVRQMTPFELASLRRNPKGIKELLDQETMQVFPPDMQAAVARMQELLSQGRQNSAEGREVESRIQAAMSAPQRQDGILSNADEAEEKYLDLGKNWHLLHYLITGSADNAPPPFGNAILGGTPIGPDLGYGPARFLTPSQVTEVAQALAAIDRAELARRFVPSAIARADIYPSSEITESSDPVGEDEGYLFFFSELVDYYAEAARNGNGMLLYIR